MLAEPVGFKGDLVLGELSRPRTERHRRDVDESEALFEILQKLQEYRVACRDGERDDDRTHGSRIRRYGLLVFRVARVDDHVAYAQTVLCGDVVDIEHELH